MNLIQEDLDCFESSNTKIRTMDILEQIYNQTDPITTKPTDFAKSYRKYVYNISFANKKAKFLGTELADIISYGYYLKLNRKLSSNKIYSPLWDKIKKREKEVKSELICYTSI